MMKEYVCKECGFMVSDLELADWPKHEFVNKDFLPPDKIPEYDLEKDCEGYDLFESHPS